MRYGPMLAVLLVAGAAWPAAGRDPAPQPTVAMSPALTKLLAGMTPGKAVSCISLPQVQGQTIVGRDTIVYRMSGRLSYVNQPPGGCMGLASDRAIVSRTSSTQLCSGDIITVIDPPARIPYGSCGLGDFVPFTKPKK